MYVNRYLVHFIGNLTKGYEEALCDLTQEQLYYLPNQHCCHIAFHAWHFIRTEDNIINFVCQNRKQPVWIRQELPDKWGLPRVEQGTDMPREQANALRLPGIDPFISYIRDVWTDIEPYLANVDEQELQSLTKMGHFADMPKLHVIGQTILAHGNLHLGEIMAMRSFQGLRGDPR